LTDSRIFSLNTFLKEAKTMNLTKHAEKRKNQRGFSKFTIDIILKNGSVKKAPGGTKQIFFGNKEYQETVSELKRVIQLLDRAKGGTIIVHAEQIITIYKACCL
jgi:hypothetical protein